MARMKPMKPNKEQSGQRQFYAACKPSGKLVNTDIGKKKKRKKKLTVRQGRKSNKTHVPGTSCVKKPYRFKAGTVALREIRRFQSNADLLLRKRPFMRYVHITR